MTITIGILLFFALSAAFLMMRGKQNATARKPALRQKTSHGVSGRKNDTKYHAVSIKLSIDACEAARRIEGIRFLSKAAPKLPLEDCSATECTCRFLHFRDRRSGEDRRSPYGTSIAGGTGRFQKEQRAAGDRRAAPPHGF